MPRKKKIKSEDDEIQEQTSAIVKKIKSLVIELAVREWINSPVREWGNKNVIQLVREGRGEEVLEAIKTAEKQMKEERENSKNET